MGEVVGRACHRIRSAREPRLLPPPVEQYGDAWIGQEQVHEVGTQGNMTEIVGMRARSDLADRMNLVAFKQV